MRDEVNFLVHQVIRHAPSMKPSLEEIFKETPEFANDIVLGMLGWGAPRADLEGRKHLKDQSTYLKCGWCRYLVYVEKHKDADITVWC